MKSLKITGLVIITVITLASGQTNSPFNAKFSAEYELPKKHEALGFFGTEETGYAALSMEEDKRIVIRNIDKSFAIKKTTPVDLSNYPDDLMNEGVYQLSGKTYWFYSNYDKKEEVQHLSMREIDIANAQIKSKVTEQLTTHNKLEGEKAMKSYGVIGVIKTTNKFSFYYNSDHTKLLVTYTLKKESSSEKKNMDRIGLLMLDSNMNKIWAKEIQMPYFEAEMSIEDLQPDGKGNAYILIKKYAATPKKDVLKDGISNSAYEMMRIDNTGNMKTIKIISDNILIVSLNVFENSDYNPVLVGYYSQVIKKDVGIDGLFYAKVDNDGNISKYKNGTYEFPLELIVAATDEKYTKEMQQKEAKGGNAQLNGIETRKVIFNADGSMIVIGEECYTSTEYYSQGGQSTSVTAYHNDDVYITCIANDGKQEWIKKAPKRQMHGGQEIFPSLSAFSMDDGYYVFYLDNNSNLTIKPNQSPFEYNGHDPVLTCVSISKNGELSKSKIADVSSENGDIDPVSLVKLNNKLIMSNASKGSKASKLLALKKL